jgi:hypothetical protein
MTSAQSYLSSMWNKTKLDITYVANTKIKYKRKIWTYGSELNWWYYYIASLNSNQQDKYMQSKAKQSHYTPRRRLGGEEV